MEGRLGGQAWSCSGRPHGHGSDWHRACRACIEGLADLPPAANLGFVYASDPLADALDLIGARLAEATGIRHWVGTGGAGVCGSGQEYIGQGAIVALVASLPARSFRLFDGLRRRPDRIGRQARRAWAEGDRIGFGVVHGDPRHDGAARTIARLSADSGAFLVGGLTSAAAVAPDRRPADRGRRLGRADEPRVPLITGLSQGCTPIGPVHEVTASQGPVGPDHRWPPGARGAGGRDRRGPGAQPAAHRRLSSMPRCPLPGSDRADYVVRPLLAHRRPAPHHRDRRRSAPRRSAAVRQARRRSGPGRSAPHARRPAAPRRRAPRARRALPHLRRARARTCSGPTRPSSR